MNKQQIKNEKRPVVTALTSGSYVTFVLANGPDAGTYLGSWAHGTKLAQAKQSRSCEFAKTRCLDIMSAAGVILNGGHNPVTTQEGYIIILPSGSLRICGGY